MVNKLLGQYHIDFPMDGDQSVLNNRMIPPSSTGKTRAMSIVYMVLRVFTTFLINSERAGILHQALLFYLTPYLVWNEHNPKIIVLKWEIHMTLVKCSD